MAEPQPSVLPTGLTPISPVISTGLTPVMPISPVISTGLTPVMPIAPISPVISTGLTPVMPISPVISTGLTPVMPIAPISPVISTGLTPVMPVAPVIVQGSTIPPFLSAPSIPLGPRPTRFSATSTSNADLGQLGLPINSHLPAISKLISTNPILVVSAPTGVGKSIGIPWYLARMGYRVLSAVPTVTAVESLAARQKQVNPSIAIGVAAESIVDYNKDSQIIYATYGHIKNRMLDFYRKRLMTGSGLGEVQSGSKPIWGKFVSQLIEQTDILILDEIQVGQLDSTLIYELMLYGQQIDSIRNLLPNILLATATLEKGKYSGAPIYEIKIESSPITQLYHTRNYLPYERLLLADTAKIVYSFHIHPETKGDFLVFVPGRNELSFLKDMLERLLTVGKKMIKKIVKKEAIVLSAYDGISRHELYFLKDMLEQLLSERGKIAKKKINEIIKKEAIVLSAYSGMQYHELRKIFNNYRIDRATGQTLESPPRKIIIATNLLELSITVEGIDWIFDTMTEKISSTSSAGGFKLTLQNISISSAIQRCGRTGRGKPGICYRMCQGDFFLRLKQYRQDEIYRIPIHIPILELFDAGLKPTDLVDSAERRGILGIVPKDRIETAMKLLSSLDLLDINYNILPAGRLTLKLPLSMRNASLLIQWLQFKTEVIQSYPPYPGIVAIAMIDSYGPSYFWYPEKKPGISNSKYQQEQRLHRRDYYERFIGYSDVETFLNMWLMFISEVGIKPRRRTVVQWCKNNTINIRIWTELINKIRLLIKISAELGHPVTISKFTAINVVNAIRPLAANVYQDLIMKHLKTTQPSYYHYSTKQQYYLEQRRSVNKFGQNYPPYIIPLVLTEIKGKKPLHMINVGLDLEKKP